MPHPMLVALLLMPLLASALLSTRPSVTTAISSTRLGLFGNLFNNKRVSTPAAVTANTAAKPEYTLEKISKTQGRDYNKEFEEELKRRRPKELADKQLVSFNFNRADQFPNLFKGWLKADGDQIAKQMVKAASSALRKERYLEILFDPVPNLDEVAFGTEWNMKLRKEVNAYLKVPDYATKKGASSTLEWSNIYWATRLAQGLGKRVLALTLTGEGTASCKTPPILYKGMTIITMPEAKKLYGKAGEKAPYDVVVVLSPCQEGHYSDAKKVGDNLGLPVVALNSPYSFRYDVGGGKPFNLAYVMKRIPKGWIFRQYPGKFECIIEGPNYEVFKAGEFAEQPSLPEVSKLSMVASAGKYGAAGNDRIFQNRL